MRLGALIKQMKTLHLYSPRPKAPFVGLSVASLAVSLRFISTPEWYLGRKNGGLPYVNEKHTCSLGQDIERKVGSLDLQMDALKLEQFVS
jgi:hypothetical protein